MKRINYFSKQILKASDYLIIPYEKLLEDYSIFRKLIKFSDFQYDENIIQHAINFSSFENMRSLEEDDSKEKTKDEYFAREGKSFKFPEYFSKRQGPEKTAELTSVI